jgi:hypothetical protein
MRPTLSPAFIRRTAASFISRLKTRAFFGISSRPENCLYCPCLTFGVQSSCFSLKARCSTATKTAGSHAKMSGDSAAFKQAFDGDGIVSPGREKINKKVI